MLTKNESIYEGLGHVRGMVSGLLLLMLEVREYRIESKSDVLDLPTL